MILHAHVPSIPRRQASTDSCASVTSFVLSKIRKRTDPVRVLKRRDDFKTSHPFRDFTWLHHTAYLHMYRTCIFRSTANQLGWEPVYWRCRLAPAPESTRLLISTSYGGVGVSVRGGARRDRAGKSVQQYSVFKPGPGSGSYIPCAVQLLCVACANTHSSRSMCNGRTSHPLRCTAAPDR